MTPYNRMRSVNAINYNYNVVSTIGYLQVFAWCPPACIRVGGDSALMYFLIIMDAAAAEDYISVTVWCSAWI
jgi:hypothetical protein